jgi:hypothetical protein
MQTITTNAFYEVKVDKQKNRFYVKVIGFWETPGIIPEYIEHIRMAVNELKNKFTAVLDLSAMKNQSQIMEEQAHQAASLIAIKRGLLLSVQILPQDPEARILIERIAKAVGKKIISFETSEKAENFLDNYIKKSHLSKKEA